MELMKAIELRQSTRGYKAEQISDETLNTILKAGSAAPVGMGAYNTVHLTVVQNADLLNEFTEATKEVFNNPKMNPFFGAPTLIIVSGKPSEKAPNIEVHNGACIVENMALAATDLGLGNVYLLGFLLAISTKKELIEKLSLPDGFIPVAALAIGHPNEPLTEKGAKKHTIETNVIK